MESSVSTSDTLVRPWRTAAVLASAVAAVELVVLIGFLVALFGQPLLDRVKGSAASAAPAARKHVVAAVKSPVTRPTRPAAPRLARSETSVLVLNGNGIAGAAASAARLVRHQGYVVAAVGNAARSDYGRSLVMYHPGYAPEAARFARDLGVKIVSPLDGMRVKDLMGAHVAVVLGAS